MRDLVPSSEITSLVQAGLAADEYVRANRLSVYQRGLSNETLRRQRADINLFREFLGKAGIQTGDMFGIIHEWHGVTFGLIEGFKEWQYQQGYAIDSINVRLATIKKYAEVAHASGVIDRQTAALIKTVKGFRNKEKRNADEKREIKRVGPKKAKPPRISSSHMRLLKELLEQDMTFLGRRDFLLVCLLGYQGFRCGEVAKLKVDEIYLDLGLIVLYRHKVDKTQRHKMHPTTLHVMQSYLKIAKPHIFLFEGVDRKEWADKSGRLHGESKATDGLSTRAINDRLRHLGSLVGIEKLSPHDLRHYWTFDLFEHGTSIEDVREAGGWSTFAMPARYKGDSAIANNGVKQSN